MPGPVSRKPVYTIQGRELKMPVVVRDASSGNAMFMVDAAAVAKLLPGDAFEVFEVAPGQTQVILGIIDYRDNDLGDYNEAAIIFFVKPRGAGPEAAGTFIYKLPVNQSFTRDAGFQIWGFPKTVEQLDIDYAGDRATGTLVMDGRHVLTLTLPRGDAEPAGAATALATYTYIDGVAHRTAMSNGGGTRVSGDTSAVKLELGDHPLADELRGLGLPERRPVMCTWTEHMSGVFEAPEKL